MTRQGVIRSRAFLAGVHFAYPARADRPVLSGLSLRAEPGQAVALVGGSGSGKSTIFHLLQHFYEPSSGFVALDGVDVSQLSHRWQGLTLVHFSAQFKCPLWDRGCMLGVFTGCQGVLGSV